jgi:hypothetical protein
MPNIPQQETIVQYITNSAQMQYTFAFYAPLNTDIQVYYQSSTATPIPSADILTLNVGYTVTFNADPITGGYITLLFTPTTGFYLTINRQVGASLNTNFAAAQNFNGANLDAALDRLLLLCQQNQNYALERNLSYIINTYLPNAVPFTQLPPLAQNQFWIGSGAGVVAATVAMVPSASVLQSMLASNSPGTDGARLIGYYDTTNTFPTTVEQFLGYKVASAYDVYPSANTMSVTLASNYQFFPGNILIVRANNSNTSAVSLAVNGGAAKSVVKYGTNGTFVALTGGEMTGAGFYTFNYIQTSDIWLLTNPNSNVSHFFYGASVFQSGTQVVGAGSTLVHFNSIDYDNFSMFNSFQNSLSPQRPGYYLVTGLVIASPLVFTGSGALNLFKNGLIWATLEESTLPGGQTFGGSFTILLNGTTDYVQLEFANASGGNVTIGALNFFQISYLGQ